MQCRLATTEDKRALYALWQNTFGDEPAVIDRFFQCVTPNEIVVCGENGSPVSALYMPRVELRCGKKTLSAAYIYAAATDTAYRGRGLMTYLLQFAAENAQRQSLDGLYLVPAERTMFDYYGARGFVIAFFKKLVQYSRSELKALCENPATALPASALQFFKTREQALQEIWHPAYSQTILDFSLFLNKQYGSETLLTDCGYAVYESEENAVQVTDFCCEKGKEAALLGALLQKTEAEKFAFSMPVPRQIGSCPSKIVPAGMWRPLSKSAKQTEMQNGYIGITLG